MNESLVHDVAESWNALAKHWDTEYVLDTQGQTVGNVKSVTDPLGQKWQYEYDSLNNLMVITPPADDEGNGNTSKQTRFKYDDPYNPTSPTQINEAGSESSPDATTWLTYFGPTDGNFVRKYGRIKSVKPPFTDNWVLTTFDYDQWGQLNSRREGGILNLTEDVGVVGDSSSSNAAGQVVGSGNGVTCSETDYDANGNVESNECNEPPCFAFITETAVPAAISDGRPQACSAPSPFAGASWLKAGCFTSLEPYLGMGQPQHQRWCVIDPTISGTQEQSRDVVFTYDELDRLRTLTQKSAEVTGSLDNMLVREFQYNPDWSAGTMTTIGPDGHVEVIATDAAGRVVSFERKDASENTIMSATMEYDAANRVTLVSYGSGANTAYEYDDANRLTRILHQVSYAIVQDLQYTWTPDGLVDYIVDTDENNSASVIDFTYDNRNRLTEEKRTGLHTYWRVYTYDKAGNRLTRTVKNVSTSATISVTAYKYDVLNPTLYQSKGNRLMSEETRDGSNVVMSQRWYEYDKRGRPILVMRQYAGDSWVYGTRFAYDARELLWLTLSEKWQIGTGGAPTNCTKLAAMEYRNDSGRSRYMVRPRNPLTLLPMSASPGLWHDYDGSAIWGDYNFAGEGDPPVLTALVRRAHKPGIAQAELLPDDTVETSYLFGNLIGTTERMMNASNEIARRAVFTAFGEPIHESGATDTRYGYAGAWGYQEAGTGDPLAELGWIHVGARYYDPASGRFVQRDPIGIEGGLNAYAYMDNVPTASIDVEGLDRMHVRDQTPLYRGGVYHEAIFLQLGRVWVRIDFGPWRGDNIRTTFSTCLSRLMRTNDLVLRTRRTSRAEDLAAFLHALKYRTVAYEIMGFHCKDFCAMLFPFP